MEYIDQAKRSLQMLDEVWLMIRGTPAPARVGGHSGMSYGELDDALLVASPSERLALEVVRREQQEEDINGIKALILAGKFDQALAVAAKVSGVSRYWIRSTDDFRKVLPKDEPMPRGGGYGVTLPGPKIYISQQKMTAWAGGQLGNLFSTLRHEATHAAQFEAGPPEPLDVREFEAYTAEVFTAVKEWEKDGSPKALPSEPEAKKAFDSAKDHYDEIVKLTTLSDGRMLALKGLWDSTRALWARLQRALRENDVQTGETERRRAHLRDILVRLKVLRAEGEQAFSDGGASQVSADVAPRVNAIAREHGHLNALLTDDDEEVLAAVQDDIQDIYDQFNHHWR